MSSRTSTPSLFEQTDSDRPVATTRFLGAAALVGVALLIATALQARAVGRNDAAATEPKSAPRAATVAAEGRVVTYPGGEVSVGAERAGRLVRVLVSEGSVVRRDQPIAEIDADEVEAARDEAQARVAEAAADVRLAESTLARRQELVDQKVLAVHGLDEARRDLDAAQARQATAQATLDRQEAQLRKSVVRAPIAGTVIGRHVDAGESVQPGTPVVTVADLSRVRIDAESDEADAGALAVGSRVTVRADGYPGRTWRGQVEEVGDAVGPRRLRPKDPGRPSDTRVVTVKVALAEPTPLKLGTTVELAIDAAARTH